MVVRNLILITVTLTVLAAGPARAQNAPANTLSQSESQQGWILLCDGNSLNGWEARLTGGRGGQPAGQPNWTVENGALICQGKVPSWIGTTASFSDFVLKLEFRGRENVNSGVFLRSQKEGAPHRTGYELQIWDRDQILTFAAGTPQNVDRIGDTNAVNQLGNYPHATGISPFPDNPTVDNFWNIDAFDTTDPTLSYLSGSAGRNVLRKPGTRQWDFSVLKNFSIREGHSLQFRFETFNRSPTVRDKFATTRMIAVDLIQSKR